MRYSPHTSLEDVSKAGDIVAGAKLMLESTRGAKFGRYSRVCRRTFGYKSELHKIPENETLDFKRIVRLPQVELIPSSKAHVAPPGTKVKINQALDSSKEENRKKRTGFWKVFKLNPRTEKQKNLNHHSVAASLLSFV